MSADLFLPIDVYDARDLLEVEWSWLLEGLPVRMVRLTVWGDWFLEDVDTGEVYFLHTGLAMLEKVALSRVSLGISLRDPKRRSQWLLADEVAVLRARGIVPTRGQCYGWTICPSLGGPIDVDNVECTGIALHQRVASRSGYITRMLPEGESFPTLDLFQHVMDTLTEPLSALRARLYAHVPVK